jgi:hypothetical protein
LHQCHDQDSSALAADKCCQHPQKRNHRVTSFWEEIPERRRNMERGVNQSSVAPVRGIALPTRASSVPNRRVVARVLRYRARPRNCPPNGTTFDASLGGTFRPEGPVTFSKHREARNRLRVQPALIWRAGRPVSAGAAQSNGRKRFKICAGVASGNTHLHAFCFFAPATPSGPVRIDPARSQHSLAYPYPAMRTATNMNAAPKHVRPISPRASAGRP